MIQPRRTFVKSMALLAGASSFSGSDFNFLATDRKILSCNQYAWFTFFNRENRDWNADLDASLLEYTSAGFKALEPSAGSVDEIIRLVPYLKKYHIAMPSLYVNSTLHSQELAVASIASVLKIADEAKKYGTEIIVTNPNPLKWGGTENKSDGELQVQAQSLNNLGAQLRERGMKLAYHTHDIELRAAAREFHHMLLATDPKNVSLCLDVHWVYRGSGNSQIALFDIVKLYGKRIIELHIRQSVEGVWQESFGEGDIDYLRLAQELDALGVKPQLVLEQCLEKESPHQLTVVEAHKKDIQYAKRVFGI